MIHFNELRITPDSKFLVVEVEVDSEKYFDDVIIDSIIINNQESFMVNGPSDKYPSYIYDVNEEHENVYAVPDYNNCNPVQVKDDLSYCYVDDLDKQKKVRLVISAKELEMDLTKDILFVYAKAKAVGPSIAEAPCGWDKDVIMKSVVNLFPIYTKMIGYIRELNNECETPKGFINAILQIKALELSIKTGNYLEAISIWKKFFKDIDIKILKDICSCYGESY